MLVGVRDEHIYLHIHIDCSNIITKDNRRKPGLLQKKNPMQYLWWYPKENFMALVLQLRTLSTI